ncbi:MAG: hypothetical protein Kow0099_00430 [Candidatus Abyssubacteria bacterium]
MQVKCVRCHKIIDSVQGYKFSPTEYLCMPCYDQYRAERVARSKKQHKNPLVDQFGAETKTPPARPAPAEPSPQAGAFRLKPPASPPVQRPATEPSPAPGAAPAQPPKPAVTPAADVCDICKKPLTDFKIPLKGGKKVCWDCNGILRELAKSIPIDVKCPNCGKEFQATQE